MTFNTFLLHADHHPQPFKNQLDKEFLPRISDFGIMESSMIFRIIQKFGAVAALVAYQAAGPAFLPAAPNRVYFDRISLESGLSQSIVTALYQDRQGFLWLGTPDGLFRYDGYEFTPYRFESNNPRSLSNN